MRTVNTFLLATIIITAITSCQQKTEKSEIIDKIQQQEENYSQAINQGRNSKNIVKPLLKLYENYYRNFPKDTVAAAYLMKGGQTAMHSNMNQKAIRFFDAVETGFSNTSHYPMAIFMKGFVYDNAGDTTKARLYYKKFINEYPDHKLAKDAHISIENLGKSLDEIVKNFDAK